MRIVTYTDPFKIRDNSELWKLITEHPVFCASDTLVQGTTIYYGQGMSNSPFGIIRTVKDLVNSFLGEYCDNPINDIQFFVTVSDYIRKWPEGELKESFLFNRSEIVKAIQLLIPLKCEKSRFLYDKLPEEQQRFLDIYEHVKSSPCYESFKTVDSYGFDAFVFSVRISQISQICYLLENSIYQDSFAELRNQSFKMRRDPDYAVRIGEKAVEILLEKKRREGLVDPTIDDEINKIRHAIEYCMPQPEEYYKTVVINGVHRLTPLLYYTINKLESIGVEVIIMFNYAKGLPEIYGTWDRVYEWCGAGFEFVSELDLSSGNPVGRALFKSLSGKRQDEHINNALVKYDNLTAFAMNEVGKTYNDAIGRARTNTSARLARMRTQYYAVNGKRCNELLQMYYPEQYKGKAFLSFPIGQLILGLYQMWDFQTHTIKFNYKSLNECAVSGLFENNLKILELLRKTELYFSDIETYDDYHERISVLREGCSMTGKKAFRSWKKISFMSLSPDEINDFESFIERIRDYAVSIFSEMNEELDYLKHFRSLVDIITSTTGDDTRSFTNTENQLLDEIRQRLSGDNGRSVSGNSQDVKDALAFYMAGRKESDSSNWIVRDFEQLDGAVLLSGNNLTRASKYNFALLSNEHMLSKAEDDLPWPLTDDFFSSYTEAENGIRAINAANRERRGFLRYILFYGAFFSKKTIEFSYVAEEDGNIQKPYYLLDVIGIKPDGRSSGIDLYFRQERDAVHITGTMDIDAETNEMYGVCPCKFLINKVVRAEIIYYSEFHVKYYMYYSLREVMRCRAGERISDIRSDALSILRKYFPFWGDVVHMDIINEALKDFRPGEDANINYKRRKENYLVAKWVGNNGNNIFPVPDMSIAIGNYMDESRIYPVLSELPPDGICDDCSFNSVCLRHYYSANAEEGD